MTWPLHSPPVLQMQLALLLVQGEAGVYHWRKADAAVRGRCLRTGAEIR
ncbi:MAG: hypothetical protein ACM3SS_03670 [Rhodospirillaceae bacterium]